MLIVPYLSVLDVNDPLSIAESMTGLKKNYISNVNWSELSSDMPKVFFKIAHNNQCLFIHYFVEEQEILAEVKDDNGPVSCDSCVEFFISFDDSPYYYNAEFSCIGKMLFAYRKNRSEKEVAPLDIISSVRRYSSLGYNNFGKRTGEINWDILVVIPAAAFWHTSFTSFQGIRAKANLYKCGDKLTVPHYLSWKKVESDQPNFHLPQYFGELILE